MEQTEYQALRDKIKDGDIVFFDKPASIWGKITQWVTRSEFYHAAFCFWMIDPGPRLMVLEAAKGGRRIISLSSYVNKGHGLRVLRLNGFDWSVFAAEGIDKSGEVPYGYSDLVSIGLLELFGIRSGDSPSGEVCSEMVAKGLHALIPDLVTSISPGKLFKSLSADPNVTEIK